MTTSVKKRVEKRVEKIRLTVEGCEKKKEGWRVSICHVMSEGWKGMKG